MTYREAMREAIREALRADQRVFLMGEDVGRYGGCFAVSKGLLEEFGPERIRDTPLSESAFVGAGIGAALGGMRPIVEIMTVNFSLLALDQIVNNAATLPHMSGGQFSVPLVIRMATGAGRQLAAQHSHSLEGWYAHVPGIRVLRPATLEDARGMLAPALADPEPGAHLRARRRSTTSRASCPTTRRRGRHRERARSAGRATDVTLIAYGGTLAKALDAAERSRTRASTPRCSTCASLRPLDEPTILDVGRADAPRRDRRRGLAQRQPRGGGQRADHGGRLLRARRAGRARLQRRGADALRAAPRARGAAAGRRSSSRAVAGGDAAVG